MTTQTITLQWRRLPSPSLNGLNGQVTAGSVRLGTSGVQQSADGLGLFVWSGGNMIYYDTAVEAWNGPHLLNGGTGNPGSWAPVYKSACMYWDLAATQYVCLNLISGEEAYFAGGGISNNRFALKIKSSPKSTPPYLNWFQYLNDFGGAAPPLYWNSAMPGYVTTAFHQVLSVSSLVVLINYQAPLFPRILNAIDVGISNNSVDLWFDGYMCRTLTSGQNTGSNAGIIPGRVLKRSPSVVSPGNPSAPYFDPSVYWTFFRRISGTYDWTGWDLEDGNPPVSNNWFAYQDSESGAIDSLLPTNFETTIGQLGKVLPFIVQGENCYVQAQVSGTHLDAVTWVPYSLAHQSFGPLPITLPPPAGFNRLSWAVFALNGIPHILDTDLNFYSLELALWDNVRLPLANWTRIFGQ